MCKCVRVVGYSQRTLIVSGKYQCTVGPSMTGLDLVVLVHSKNIFSCLVESNSVKLETSRTVIFPLKK